MPDKYKTYFICFALTIITLSVFWQVHTFDFVNYDDDKYISENEHITSGLTFNNIVWAFKEPHFFMWHPMTTISNIVDYHLFGLKPGWHHLTNLILHILNILLLFGILKAMTARIWPSAFVAAIFALHPLNVESVAWISERKNVLSTFFWMLTVVAYIRYVKYQHLSNYLLVIFTFALALMSKPVTVTLPFVLLLLDYWPLNRDQIGQSSTAKWQTWWSLIREKIPLFILSAILCVITVFAQRSGGVIMRLEMLPMRLRLANAVISYVRYISKTFWPASLAALYPLNTEELTAGWIAAASVLLLLISIRVIQLILNYKYLFTGWFWYLSTLVPVIGIVQAGSQAFADRYAYVPLIGLFIIIAWGFDDLFAKVRNRKIILSVLALAAIAVLTICTGLQVRYWKNSISLWEHALKVTRNNSTAHYNLATALAQKGRFEEAAEHCRIAIQLRKIPKPEMLCNMGNIYNNLGRHAESIEAYAQTLNIDPNYTDAYVGLANTLGKIGRHAEAEQACKLAIKIKPEFAEAYSTLGAAYISQGRWMEAIESLKQAVRIKPDYTQAHYNLGLAYLRTSNEKAALEQYEILKTLDAKKANSLLNMMMSK